MFYAGFDILFSILFPILFLVVLGMILYTIIGNISTWNKNNHSPRLTVPATGWQSARKFLATIQTIRWRIRSRPIM